jgi:hypothetical protein
MYYITFTHDVQLYTHCPLTVVCDTEKLIEVIVYGPTISLSSEA